MVAVVGTAAGWLRSDGFTRTKVWPDRFDRFDRFGTERGMLPGRRIN